MLSTLKSNLRESPLSWLSINLENSAFELHFFPSSFIAATAAILSIPKQGYQNKNSSHVQLYIKTIVIQKKHLSDPEKKILFIMSKSERNS